MIASSRETAGDVSQAVRDLGFNAGGMGEFLNQINTFFTTMRLILGGVGGIALLVAAFGVANTMTMAILERTREIGLMKAIGATDRDVLTIFLIEAGLVGLVGGLSGLAVSYVIQNLINEALRNLPQGDQGGGFIFLPVDTSQIGGNLLVIPPELALFALSLATLVGICAGLVPGTSSSAHDHRRRPQVGVTARDELLPSESSPLVSISWLMSRKCEFEGEQPRAPAKTPNFHSF